jgi:hypothetical protein
MFNTLIANTWTLIVHILPFILDIALQIVHDLNEYRISFKILSRNFYTIMSLLILY